MAKVLRPSGIRMLSPPCNTHMSLFKDQGERQKRGHKKWREKIGRCAAKRPASSEHSTAVALTNSLQLWLSAENLHRTDITHIKDGGRGLMEGLLEASGFCSVWVVKYKRLNLSYWKCICLILRNDIKALPFGII